MIPFVMPDSAELVRSLMSEQCPCCKGPKIKRNTFCQRCYFNLGRGLRNALYQRVGEGYEEAFEAACLLLIRKGRWRDEPEPYKFKVQSFARVRDKAAPKEVAP